MKLFLLLPILLLLSFTSCVWKKKEVTLITSIEGSAYYNMAKAIQKEMKTEGWDVKLYPTINTAEALKNRKGDIALISNHQYIKDSDIQTVIPLSEKTLIIQYKKQHFTQKPSNIKELTLKRKVLVLEAEEELVKSLLLHYGISDSLYTLTTLNSRGLHNVNDIFNAINQIDHDVMIYLTEINSPSVNHSIELKTYEFFSLGEYELVGKGSSVDAFNIKHQNFFPFIIPNKLYGNNEPLVTISTYTLLVCQQDLSENLIYDWCEDFFNIMNRLIYDSPSFNKTSDNFDRSHLQFPLHDGASSYLDRSEPSFLERYADLMGLLLSIGAGFYGIFVTAKNSILQKQRDLLDLKVEAIIKIQNKLFQINSHDSIQLNILAEEILTLQNEIVTLITSEKIEADNRYIVLMSRIQECLNKIDQIKLHA